VATLTGPNRGAAWLLRSARTTYHKPAPVCEPIVLTGTIVQRGGLWDPVVVHTEAVRADGSLCVDGEFKVVPVARDRLAALAGIETLPENWIALLSDGS
jgi:acyl-CoA thioesterase FadM